MKFEITVYAEKREYCVEASNEEQAIEKAVDQFIYDDGMIETKIERIILL